MFNKIIRIINLLSQLIRKYRKILKKNFRHSYKQKKAIEVYERINEIKEFQKVIAYLRKIDPFVFEELILYSFEMKGFKVYRNRRYTGDGGIDGKVRFYGKKTFIQAKRYSNYINIKHVEDFAKLCTRNRVNGFFIHTGKTGEETKKLSARHKNIRIVSGSQLMELFLED